MTHGYGPRVKAQFHTVRGTAYGLSGIKIWTQQRQQAYPTRVEH